MSKIPKFQVGDLVIHRQRDEVGIITRVDEEGEVVDLYIFIDLISRAPCPMVHERRNIRAWDIMDETTPLIANERNKNV